MYSFSRCLSMVLICSKRTTEFLTRLYWKDTGRKAGYSLGITMGDAAELLLKYGVVTAAACDGGSSSVLAYDGAIINKPSTPMVTGRYLPNAFLVKSKNAD